MPTRADLAKIHIAKKELGISDDEYRDILKMKFNKSSARDLTDREACLLLAGFEQCGWRPKRPDKKKSGSGFIEISNTSPAAKQKRYVLKLWAMLGYEPAKLNVRIKKQFNTESILWLHDHDRLHILITDLEARCRRAGVGRQHDPSS